MTARARRNLFTAAQDRPPVVRPDDEKPFRSVAADRAKEGMRHTIIAHEHSHILSGVTLPKEEADACERLTAFTRVGLPVNGPPGITGLPFI